VEKYEGHKKFKGSIRIEMVCFLDSGADSAFISQNVYLYCVSEGLATGVRALMDKAGLAKDMKLRNKQKSFLYRLSVVVP
jgi:hypothetical protein